MMKSTLLAIAIALFASQTLAFSKPPQRCVVGGCSNQLCVDASQGDVMSTCEWTAAYGCYSKHSTCEVQPNGACGWTPTAPLEQCLANPEKEFPLN